jgi:ABC-type uncharacterized transport system permease subunit
VRVNAHVEETQQQKQKKTDEMVQLVMGVALMAFAVIAIAVLLAIRVSDVLSHPY